MNQFFRHLKKTVFVLPTYVLLFVSLSLTALAFLVSLSDERKDSKSDFNQIGLLIGHKIRSQISKEAQLLLQFEGLLHYNKTSQELFEQQAHYLKDHSVGTNFAYLGFIKTKPSQTADEELPSTQNQNSTSALTPTPPNEAASIDPDTLEVKYFVRLESAQDDPKWSYSFSDNNDFRSALRRARDSGVVAFSHTKHPLTGRTYYMAFLPVYQTPVLPERVSTRRRQVDGYLFGLLPFEGLVNRAMGADDSLLSLASVRIYDRATPGKSLIFSSGQHPSQPVGALNAPLFDFEQNLSLGQRPLTLAAQSTPFFESQSSSRLPWLILIIGGIASLAIFWFSRLMAQAGEALQQSETQLRLVTDSLPVLVSYIDTDRRYVFHNQALDRWFPELASHDIKGKTFQDVWGVDVYATFKPYFDRALDGQLVNFEYHLQRNQADRYVRVTLVPDEGQHNRVQGFITLVSDISDIFRAHQRLRDKKQTLEVVNKIGLSLQNERSLEKLMRQVTEASMDLARAQGAAFFLAEDIDSSFTEPYITVGDHRPWTPLLSSFLRQRLLWPAREKKSPIRLSYVKGMLDSEVPSSAFGSLLAVPITSGQQRLLGVMLLGHSSQNAFTLSTENLIQSVATQAAVAMDNAKLYRALRDSESRHRELAEWNSFLAEVSRILAESLDHNQTLKEVAHYMLPKMGDWCSIHVKSEDGLLEPLTIAHQNEALMEKAWNTLERALKTPKSDRGPVRTFKTGQPEYLPTLTEDDWRDMAFNEEHLSFLREIKPNSLISVPIRAHGQVFGVLSFALNQEDQHLRSYSREDLLLAEEVARRISAALENSKLYKDAQAISRVKDEFLTIISHELRTPLNVILGYSDLLSETEFDDETKEFILAIRRNALAQARLIDDLLDVSSIIRGQFRINPDPVDLKKVTNSAIESLALAAQAKEIQIAFREVGETSHCHVLGDPNRLQQVIWHLISNAIKFTSPKGFVQVEIKHSPDSCRIDVTDTGQGIDTEFLPHIFERFRQQESGMTRPHGGLGLGLAIVKHVVELHGGSVVAHSRGRGHGAKFSVILPVSQIQPTTSAPRSMSSSSQSSPSKDSSLSLASSPQ